MLTIEDLRAGYGGKGVLSGVSLTARDGELTALLGENGGGKTTLLRAALGLIPAKYARCTVDGEDLPAASPKRRAALAAYIPQRARFDPGLTALEAALMGANARTPLLSRYSAEDRALASECLAQLGAAEWADRLLGELSEGQRRLCRLARALVQRPRVFLLDEPDGALDLPRRFSAMEALRALLADGRAALAAVHDAQLALSRADRVLVLKDGRIARELDPREDSREEIEEAMRLLYGDVRVGGSRGAWCVYPETRG